MMPPEGFADSTKMKLIDAFFPSHVHKDGKTYRVQQIDFNRHGQVVGVRVYDRANPENSHLFCGEELEQVEVLRREEGK